MVWIRGSCIPNCNRWGHSWPCQLWHQIPDKIFMYQITKKLSSRNIFWIFFELLTRCQKMTFWCPFWRIFVRSPAAMPPCQPPPFHSVYCFYRRPEGGRSPAGRWCAVHCYTSQDSNQFPVLGHIVWGDWWVLSQACSLALSKWTAGTAPFWANSQNHSALLHNE